MKTYKFIRNMVEMRGDKKLWKLSPPLEGYTYVITSAINNSIAHETFIFPANKDGLTIDWRELKGSTRNTTNHEKALNNAGYCKFPLSNRLKELKNY